MKIFHNIKVLPSLMAGLLAMGIIAKADIRQEDNEDALQTILTEHRIAVAADDYYADINASDVLFPETCEKLKYIHHSVPSITRAVYRHYKNPCDLPMEAIDAFLKSPLLQIPSTPSTVMLRAESALHEAAHLILYTPIISLPRDYSRKILDSLSARIMPNIKGGDEVTGRTYAYEPRMLIGHEEVFLRMQMLVAGQVAVSRYLGIKHRDYLEQTGIVDHDIDKWHVWADRIGLKVAERTALLQKQEKEVSAYLDQHYATLIDLAESLMQHDVVSNDKVLTAFHLGGLAKRPDATNKE